MENVSSSDGSLWSSVQPELGEAIQDETVQVSIVNAALGWVRTNLVEPIRTSKIVQSKAFQITIIILGVLLLIAGLVLCFVLQAELGKNAFLFLIPAVVGLIKLLVSSVCMEATCTPEKWRLCKHLLGIAEDVLDDGQLNQSNTIFVDNSQSR